MNTHFREALKDKKRIVIKIGSSSLTHPETGYLDLIKLEILVREISDLPVLRATDTELNCSTANVLREVSSEMSAISAGAVFSTLKEKGIISMDKTTGTINPTKLGAWVQVRLQEDQKEV